MSNVKFAFRFRLDIILFFPFILSYMFYKLVWIYEGDFLFDLNLRKLIFKNFWEFLLVFYFFYYFFSITIFIYGSKSSSYWFSYWNYNCALKSVVLLIIKFCFLIICFYGYFRCGTFHLKKLSFSF